MPSPLDDARALALAPSPALEGYPAADAPGGLGDLARWLAAWPGADGDRPDARLRRPIACLYVTASADAGEAAPAAARAAMEALAAGAAPAAALARAGGAGLELFDLALYRPSADGARTAAMSERACAATLAFGLEALAKTPDLLVLGCVAPGEALRAARLGCALAGDD
ncbi:MAG: nicotinate-nucleotide--dimethylbenzimidazole phosphoribosyltransferase, partial [Caulobacteraceae bacterium]|nr:nicotinate-nucleotide--dimethylbenzimidazole phosphoribosyltransferase [Caulobacter sp.]